MKPDRKRGIIIGAAIGDALCSPLDGLGPGHIRSIFGRVREYLDPAPALKGRLDRWKKPALYTSISQTIMLILISAREDGGPDMDRFLRSLEDNPPVEGNLYGAFRHPGPAERILIEKRVRGPEASPSFSCARTASSPRRPGPCRDTAHLLFPKGPGWSSPSIERFTPLPRP